MMLRAGMPQDRPWDFQELTEPTAGAQDLTPQAHHMEKGNLSLIKNTVTFTRL